MNLVWSDKSWEDYLHWQANDRKLLKRVNLLIEDIKRNGNEGIGKPGPLKHQFHGYWSRRIDSEHRLVYRIAEDTVYIARCRHHYGKSDRLPVVESPELAAIGDEEEYLRSNGFDR